jgi:hypothetical protein
MQILLYANKFSKSNYQLAQRFPSELLQQLCGVCFTIVQGSQDVFLHSPVRSSRNGATSAIGGTEAASCSVAELLLRCSASAVLLPRRAGSERAAWGCAAQSWQKVLRSRAAPMSCAMQVYVSEESGTATNIFYIDIKISKEQHARTWTPS